MAQAEYGVKYWELANAIVAFSVLQMIVFLYALGGREFREQVIGVRLWVEIAILASGLLYVAGVLCCYWAERRLSVGDDTLDGRRVLQLTLWARIAIIGLYCVGGILVTHFGRDSAVKAGDSKLENAIPAVR